MPREAAPCEKAPLWERGCLGEKSKEGPGKTEKHQQVGQKGGHPLVQGNTSSCRKTMRQKLKHGQSVRLMCQVREARLPKHVAHDFMCFTFHDFLVFRMITIKLK